MKRYDNSSAVQLAGELFGEGYHCAEAVAHAALEALGEESAAAIPCATAFGGGFGESFSQACGVVTGSLIVIGHLHGRRERGASWKKPSRLGAEVVNRFAALHGTCNCGELRDRFGEEKQMEMCRLLVRQGTDSLLTILRSNDGRHEGTVSGCHGEKCGKE